MSEENRATWADNWLGYREEIKVVDVTIRDGGLMNDHQFTDDVVRSVYEACVEAGIDYMEIGYVNSRSSFRPASLGRGSTAARRTSAALSATTIPR